ncbi:MAG TPA: hypothetical protein VLA34_04905, partial [Candidatus Krumholzibacterium sp.]|nr:hypothetical protein [Candidatus Krumholzibacterium sp.]
FQCGMIGYFSHREIINLDGKVNREALDALKSGNLDGYMDEEGIDLVVDHSKILQIFFETTSDRIWRCCVPIPPAMGSRSTGWVALERSRMDLGKKIENTGSVSSPLSANRFYRLIPGT